MSLPIGSVPGLEQAPGAARVRSSPAQPASGPDAAERRNRFQNALHGLGHEIDHGEKMVRRALSAGGHMGAGDLIALQAGIYRYSEAVDLTAKLVDRAGQAVRTTLRGQ
jgi:hypothetical protein